MLRKPLPMGVAVGPFSAQPHSSMASSVPGAISSPLTSAYSAPASHSCQSMPVFSAAETARTLSAISRPMPSPGISTAFIKIRSPSLCFLNASLWEGGGPKGRRERVLPLSEASDIFNALSPRLTAGLLTQPSPSVAYATSPHAVGSHPLRGGRLSVKYCNILQLYPVCGGLSTRFFMQTASKRRAT